MRTFQDFNLRYALASVPGVAEVASVGGYQKQYQVQVDPAKLHAYGLSLADVTAAIRRSNADVGGRVIEQDDSVRGGTTRRSQAALAALALAVGFGVAAVPRLLGDSGGALTDATRGNPRAIRTEPVAAQAPSASVPNATPTVSEPPAAAAATPADAVDAFLRAEVERDFETSYGLLAAPDRTVHQSRAEWRAAHAQLPLVREFTLGAVRIVGDRAEVDSTVALQPQLDPVVGLVPGSALATWIVLAEDGGWRVDFGESALVPQYVSDTAAPAAARAWVAERTGCGASARAALLGTGRLLDELCATRGPVRVAQAVALEPSESSDPFLAAYGPDVFTWARVVPVTAPTRVGAVLAPLGPRWRVIGLVDLPILSNNPQEGAQS